MSRPPPVPSPVSSSPLQSSEERDPETHVPAGRHQRATTAGVFFVTGSPACATPSSTRTTSSSGASTPSNRSTFPPLRSDRRHRSNSPPADLLRPFRLRQHHQRKMSTMLSENAERRPSVLDNLQKQLDEAVLDMQLYGKALDAFEDDPATSGILHNHLLTTMGTPIVDKILFSLDKDNKLKNGMEFEDSEEQHVQLSTTERTFLAKDLPGQLSSKAQALVEALEGKRFDSFMDALRDTAEESGFLFKKLEERLERSMLHSYREDLIAQVSSETDPVSFLPKVVALLFLEAHNKALQVPERAVGAVSTLLKDKLPASTFKVLTEYHATTVKLLALQDAATGDEDDCTSDRMLEKKEDLEERLMPELKSLALGTSKE
ncbi:E3 UFM1-protein ligase 1 homolog [Hordeum vulgare subsp. vulgare]|uniref:Uncharacterized protein n=1 Tax=Hordeum vulgare subsp. vulgare TaxID=112509 RepID=A0A8I6WAU3_HORVV|nr:E3 UFM1-protein ligase 1 homolog [Hordeum vulgare subsp. vulgare]